MNNYIETSSGILLAKFGKKEHLEQLKDGKIFLNSIKNYRDDGTDYRGDAMEGKVLINPETIQIFDSNECDIFENVPRPHTIIQSFLDDDNLLMFCASAITKEIFEQTSSSTWKLTEEYRNNIRQFGEYVLVFWSGELTQKLAKLYRNQELSIAYEYGCINYHNLNDFSDTSVYRKAGNTTDVYFVKGLNYKTQNEWRLILIGNQCELKLNENGGYVIQSTPFECAVLMEANKFLDDLSLKEES